MGKDTTEGSIGDMQRTTTDESAAHDPNQQPATVHFLDSTKHVFYVSKKAEGSELFEKVVAFLGLNEKDYFALSFIDGDGNRHWIYEDKRISKQLKGHSWDFNFEVKFYPPDPATLNDDNTRHLLSLQVRHDISTGKLPATLATHALLGSYVAQSVRGDYEPSIQYIDFLRSCRLAPAPNETLYEKIEELHRQHKGVTPAEADLNYLENAKKLSMYGVHLFPAKDGKGVLVHVGICAHGINIYRDQIRVHRFLWQNIIKIGYRRSIFIIKVKPGELEKNESTAAFKLTDYEAAKRVWKCGVEHHTFFRLIQPEHKPHKGLFRWGSARFRYQGRTQFQSKLSSQMYNAQPVQRSQSARLTRKDESVPVPVSKHQTLPLKYSEDGTGAELGWDSSQVVAPKKPRMMVTTEIAQKKEDAAATNGVEVGGTSRTACLGGTSGKLHDGTRLAAPVTATVTTTTTVATATTTTTTATITTTITATAMSTTGHSFDQQTPTHTSSLRASPQAIQITRGAALSAEQLMGDHLYGQPLRHVSAGITSSGPRVSDLQKESDARFLPVQDTAVVYHPGHYEQQVAGRQGGALREPPVEPDDDFVLIHRPRLGAAGKIFHESGSETDILVKEEDIETYPIRYFADVYHSGFSRPSSGNKDIEVFEREKCLGSVDVVDKRKVDRKKYPKDEKFTGQILRTERSAELPTEPLKTHAYVYNQGYYDAMDSSRTDIDEKGNLRYWLRGYTKPEKFEAKITKEKTEIKKGKESYVMKKKDGTKVTDTGYHVSGLESVAEQSDEMKKTAHICVKQLPYEVQTSGIHVKEVGEKLQRTTTDESKTVTTALGAAKSSESDAGAKAYDFKQPKQIYRLFTRTAPEDKRVTEEHYGRPEAYGIPSTSYDGPLHSVKREEELSSSPIHENVAVYHSGISAVKSKKRRKLVSQKEHRKKEASSETSGDEDMSGDAKQKPTAVIHVYGADKGVGAGIAVDDQKRSVGEEFITKYMTREMEETKYPYHEKVDLQRRKYMHEIKKPESDVGLGGVEDSEIEATSEKAKAILHFSEDRSKLEPTGTKTTPETILKKTEQPKEVEYTIPSAYSVRAFSKVKPVVPPKKPLIEYATDNTPPPGKLLRAVEITFQPLHLAVLKDNFRPFYYKTFKRAKHRGAVEYVAKENVDPGSYRLDHTSYQGPLLTTNRAKELPLLPIHEHSAVYHPGNSFIKPRKPLKWKKTPKFQEEEEFDVKKTAVLHLRKDDSGAAYEDDKKGKLGSESFSSKWGTKRGSVTGTTPHSFDQHITYTANIFCKTPEEKDKTEYGKRSFRHRAFAGDVEIVGKSHVKPETYKLSTVPYEGSLSRLEHGNEVSFAPLHEYSAAYHSGISYKKAKKMRDSGSESSSSTTSSSSSSTSEADITELCAEPKKKAILHVSHAASGTTDEPRHDEGFFSSWRKSDRDKKKERFPDVKKQKPESPPKSYEVRKQRESPSDFAVSHETFGHSPDVSTASLKGSVDEPKSDLRMERESTKMSARIHIKDELPISKSTEYRAERGRFDPFRFWRSAEGGSKGSPKKQHPTEMSSLDQAFDLRSSQEETKISPVAEHKKKAIVYVTDSTESAELETTDLTRPKLMKEEPLKRGSEMPPLQDTSNIEMKKTALIHLKGDSELARVEPLGLHGTSNITTSAVITPSNVGQAQFHTSPKEEVPYEPLRAKISIQHGESGITKESQLTRPVDSVRAPKFIDTISADQRERHDDVAYLARIAVKPELQRNDAVLEKDSEPKTEEIKTSKESSSKISSFKLKGVHLRGPPSDSEETARTATGRNIKSATAESTLTAANKDVTGTFKSGMSEHLNGKKVAVLRIRDEKLVESSVDGVESKTDGGKNVGGGFFSSFWHSSKLRDSDEQQKQQKITPGDRQTEIISKAATPTGKMYHDAPQTATETGYKKEEFFTGTTTAEWQAAQDHVPVSDFSYATTKDEGVSDVSRDSRELTSKTVETKSRGGSKFRRLFGHRSKDVEEHYDASVSQGYEQPAADASQQPPKETAFVSELLREKSDTAKTGRYEQYTKPKTETEDSSLVYREATSSGETSDEPYKFTQTPPDVPVSLVPPADAKRPLGLVEQFKRQVTQVVVKASPSLDKKKKLKKEKKRSEKGTSSRGSESSNASETESASHQDSSAFDQSKQAQTLWGTGSKPEASDTLQYEEAKLDEGRLLVEKHTDEMYILKGTGDLPNIDPANAASSPPQTLVESYEETTTGPETVVTSVDSLGNIIKRTVKTQQVKHTVQRQTYQTYGIPSQPGDTGIHVVETTQESITPVGDEKVVSSTSVQAPVVETRSHTVAYESKSGTDVINGSEYSDIPGELISSRIITQGNRTIETITYKTEKDGVVETHVEHRVTIQSGENIDHDAELSQAILEATNMNPDMTVEKIEVKQESQC